MAAVAVSLGQAVHEPKLEVGQRVRVQNVGPRANESGVVVRLHEKCQGVVLIRSDEWGALFWASSAFLDVLPPARV